MSGIGTRLERLSELAFVSLHRRCEFRIIYDECAWFFTLDCMQLAGNRGSAARSDARRLNRI